MLVTGLSISGSINWSISPTGRQRILPSPLFFRIIRETYTWAKETYKLLYFTIF